MFNNKVGPSDYQALRKTFFGFTAKNKMNILEAEDVLDSLRQDLKKQVCSGIYDNDSETFCYTNNPSLDTKTDCK